jgi:hypothetical protein
MIALVWLEVFERHHARLLRHLEHLVQHREQLLACSGRPATEQAAHLGTSRFSTDGGADQRLPTRRRR